MVVGELVQERDLIVIGGGPGGYSAAIRAAQMGLDVTLVEKKHLGGVCLNEGCIPSKIFTHSTSTLADTRKVSRFGIQTGEVTFHFDQMHAWRDQVVTGLRKGVEALCKTHKIDVIYGEASFLSEDRIGVEHGHQFDTYRFKQVILATGSMYEAPIWAKPDHKCILDTTSVFKLETVPEHLIVSGSDYIALEAAFGYRELGASVTVLLETDSFGFDVSIDKELLRVMKKQKIAVVKKARVTSVENDGDGALLSYESAKGREELTASHVFVSSVPRPRIRDLGLDRAGVEVNEEGYIEVSDRAQTNVPSIYAVGDITPGPPLAIKALKQGKVAAENAGGRQSAFDLHFIPKVAHTNPPVASVGLTEAEAKEQGYSVKISEFASGGNGFASITGSKDGKTKIVVDETNDVLLGFHAIGKGAVELISNGVTALEMAARDEDLSYPYYPHPSLNENWLEAVEGLTGKAIHAPPARQMAKSGK
ncbi:dihydrolipoyl dehydrogenase [Alteribacter keqinensis]|uniref:Dihydrolipoyl dehydrogenase n=1 Tax=Alteribacter keqinensis TaxID=2483800 RepID=A0A3M7TVR6_9BACI|nr:dihydrolipoyl dehydrogenase [Alteribacter keqinensis]RNA69750.1 dihydrolipoyl dehydrogenase [Alteribacter keqinensis]